MTATGDNDDNDDDPLTTKLFIEWIYIHMNSHDSRCDTQYDTLCICLYVCVHVYTNDIANYRANKQSSSAAIIAIESDVRICNFFDLECMCHTQNRHSYLNSLCTVDVPLYTYVSIRLKCTQNEFWLVGLSVSRLVSVSCSFSM